MRTALASTTALAAALTLAGQAQAGQLTASGTPGTAANPIDFGKVLVGTTGTVTNALTITNPPGSHSRTVTASTGLGFSVAPTGGQVIAAGDSTTFTYGFKPTSIGTKTLNANITSPSATPPPTGPYVLNTRGTGVGVAPAATTGAATGFSLVGSKIGSGTATITNTGNGNQTNNIGLLAPGQSNLRGSFGNTVSGPFHVTNAGAFSLTDGASKQITYTYVTNVATATVGQVISSANNNQRSTISYVNGNGTTNGSGTVFETLRVTGVAPQAQLSTASNAGFTLVGTSKNASVTLSNTGNGNLAGADPGGAFNAQTSTNLRMSGITAQAGTPFSIPTTTASLTDGAAQNFNVLFTPTVGGAGGFKTSLITAAVNNGIGNTNASGSVTATVNGTGVAPIVGVVGSTSAGPVRIGTAGNGNISVQNIGNGNLDSSVSSAVSNLSGTASLVPAGQPRFNIGNGSISVGDGATQNVGYTFTPTAHGVVSGTAGLSFTNGDASGHNQASSTSVALGGTGVGPEFNSNYGNSPSANGNSTIDFGTILPGESSFRDLIISNDTTDSALLGDLTKLTIFSSSNITGGSPFLLTPFATAHLSPNNTITLHLSFSGLAPGTYDDTLVIRTDQNAAYNATGETFSFNLHGIILVPEPGSLLVLVVGLGGISLFRRRRA